MQNKKRSVNYELSFLTLLKKCLLNLIFFSALVLIFSLLSGLIFFRTNDPTSKIGISAYLSLYLSVAISSFVLAKHTGQRQILCGLTFGGLVVILTFTLSLIIYTGKMDITDLILKILTIIISVSASLLSRTNSRKRKHKRHR